MNRRLVVALGGNAILRRGQEGTAEEQRQNIYKTCAQLAELIRRGCNIVITHGNGPQVGNILIQNEEAGKVTPAMPLDICGAESQGLIGYMIQQSVKNLLPERTAATVLTQVLVDEADPAFNNPTKPIGPFYTHRQAVYLQKKRGLQMVEDSGRGWRKVVPSPKPKGIIEKEAILALVEKGVIVIASGGGGIPVVKDKSGNLRGIEAVIDKDLAGQQLALDVLADTLLILTDVEKVALNWGKPDQSYLDSLTIPEARNYLREGYFPAGSMGPKVEAACGFIAQGGREAIITSLDKVIDAIEGKTGTRFLRPNI